MFTTPNPERFGQTLSMLWLFAILNILFRDIHEMTMASTINDILSGTVAGNPVTEAVLLAGAFAVELLLLAFLLSTLLAPTWARLLNLILAPIAIAGTFYVPPADPDDIFFAVVEVCTFVAIFLLAWRWAPETSAAPLVGDHHAV